MTPGGLFDALVDRFARGASAPFPDEEFDAWAMRVFAHQFENNAAYGAFVRGRGLGPGEVDGWRRIPAVPVRAFRHLDLSSGCAEPERVFETSGTTSDRTRGRHPVCRLDLYHASCLPVFERHVLGDGARLPVVALLPPPSEAPASSLSEMVAAVAERFGRGDAGWFVHPRAGLDGAGLADRLARAQADGEAVLVTTTAFSLVHWLEHCDREGLSFRLPEGSRVMETGGFKGRSRTVSRAGLYAGVEAAMGVPAARVVNEYGMTELLSQYYELVLSEPVGGAPVALDERGHVPAPWLRFRILDPVTLEAVDPGRPGLIAHFDLANAGSVSAVLTEDLGRAVGGRLHVLGRAPGAEPRGCSRALDEMLSGVG